MFPDIAFDERADWSDIWRSLFEDWLGLADEPPLWGATSSERYRFQTTTGAPGLLLRVEADAGEVVAKRFEADTSETASSGWVFQEFRRQLTKRELGRLRALVERAGFWALPSPNPKNNLGLDGAQFLFEGCATGRYHLVHRWSPDRDGFARLCRYCAALYHGTVAPRRSWWPLW